MFGRKKKKSLELLSPVTGKIIPISEIDDPVFKEKVLGDGVALLPEEDDFYAPCDGTIIQVAQTFHAICLQSEDGLELLLHLGMDTVQLEGKGFTCHVKENQKVKAGDKLVTMDRAFVTEKGLEIASPFIITNLDAVTELQPIIGDAVHGKTPVMSYQNA